MTYFQMTNIISIYFEEEVRFFVTEGILNQRRREFQLFFWNKKKLKLPSALVTLCHKKNVLLLQNTLLHPKIFAVRKKLLLYGGDIREKSDVTRGEGNDTHEKVVQRNSVSWKMQRHAETSYVYFYLWYDII